MTEKRDEATLKIRENTSPSYQVKAMENIPSNAISQDKKPLMWWEKEIYRNVSPVDRQKIIMETWNEEIFSRDLDKLCREEIINTLYCSPSRYIPELRDNASQWDLRQQLLHLGDRYSYEQDDNQFYIHTYKNVKDLGITKATGVPIAHNKEFEELCDQVRGASFLLHKEEELQGLQEISSLSHDEIEKQATEDARYYAEHDVGSFGSFIASGFLFILTEEAINFFYSSSSNNNYGLYPIKLRSVDNPLLMQRTGCYSIFRYQTKDVRLNKDTLSSYRNPIILKGMLGKLLKAENEILYNFNEFEYLF